MDLLEISDDEGYEVGYLSEGAFSGGGTPDDLEEEELEECPDCLEYQEDCTCCDECGEPGCLGECEDEDE